MTAAVGREKRANTIPVMRATASKLTTDSTVTTQFAAEPSGNTCPYPIVANVSTLKKKARSHCPLVRSADDRAEPEVLRLLERLGGTGASNGGRFGVANVGIRHRGRR